jgi:predicted RNA methylase
MSKTKGAIRRHAHMVEDRLRTEPLLRAVARAVRSGNVVVDIGTGLGLLAIQAAKAGAKRVWAIDWDVRTLDAARHLASKAGVGEAISFLHGLSFDVDLPERADLVICETVGSFAFDENILATLSDAKRRLLKRGGRIIPQRLELWAAPLGRLPRLTLPAEIARVRQADLLGAPVLISQVNFAGRIPTAIRAKPIFRCRRRGMVRSIAVWPKVRWWKKFATDAAPGQAPTHWKQGILPIEPRSVKVGDRLGLELIIGPHPDDPLCQTERLWRWVK